MKKVQKVIFIVTLTILTQFTIKNVSANVDKMECVNGHGVMTVVTGSDHPFGAGVPYPPSPVTCSTPGQSITIHHFTRTCPDCAPACVPTWGAWSACSATCGPGTKTRSDGCEGTDSQDCNNGACPACGDNHEKTYERTAEVENNNRCAPSSVMFDWLDMSSLASNGGVAWTWKCSRDNKSVDCLAYKKGKCATVTGSYPDRQAACEEGLFNSVQLTTGGILKWRCGTGGQDKSLGSFTSNEPSLGPATINDNFGPKSIGSGGVECQCTPSYQSTCVDAGDPVGSCVNNCDGYITQPRVAVKVDTDCFPNETLPITNSCASRQVQCAPCGTQGSEGGSYHETAY